MFCLFRAVSEVLPVFQNVVVLLDADVCSAVNSKGRNARAIPCHLRRPVSSVQKIPLDGHPPEHLQKTFLCRSSTCNGVVGNTFAMPDPSDKPPSQYRSVRLKSQSRQTSHFSELARIFVHVPLPARPEVLRSTREFSLDAACLKHTLKYCY